MDREVDLDKVNEIHDYFDAIKNPQMMANKPKDSRDEVVGTVPDSDDENFSTDFEIDADPNDTMVYRQYRTMMTRNMEEQKVLDEREESLAEDVREYNDGGNRLTHRDLYERVNESVRK